MPCRPSYRLLEENNPTDISQYQNLARGYTSPDERRQLRGRNEEFVTVAFWRGAMEQEEEEKEEKEEEKKEEKEEEEGLKPPAQPCLAHGQPPRVIPLGCKIQMQN